MKKILLSSALLIYFLNFIHAQTGALISFTEIKDIKYTNVSIPVDSLQMLNLIVPEPAKDIPILIWIGGGAWSFVNRNMEMDLGRKIAEQEIAFATVGHRLSSAVWKDPKLATGIQHPEHIKDVARAFRWIVDHAAQFGYSKHKIFIGGYSSGAHLAALLAMDEQYLLAEGLSKDLIKGILPLAGAYDIGDYYNAFANSESNAALAETHVQAVFGQDTASFKKASPINYIDQLKTAMLLIPENNTYNYTRLFEDSLRASAYRDFQVYHVNSMGHSALWKNISYEKRVSAGI